MLHPESIAEQPLPEGGTLLETASAAKYSWPGLASFEYPKQMDDVDDNDTLDFGCVDGEEAMRLCSSDDPVTRPDPEDPEWPACVNYRISRAMEDLPEEQLEPGLVTLSIRGVLGNQSLARATGLNYITINDRGLAAQQIVKDVLFSVDLLLSTSKRAKLMLARAEREQTLKVVSNLDEAPPSNDERQSYIDFIRHPAFPGDVALAIREACEDGFGECVVLRFKGVTLKVPSSRAEQASALVTKATTSLDGFLRDWELDQDRHALSRIRMPVEKRPPPTDLAAWRRGAKLALEEIIGCSSCGGPEESFAFCIGRLLHFYLKIPIELKHQLADESSKLRAAYYETLDFHSPFPFDETARAIKILDVPKLPMHSNVFMWNDLARHAAEMAISKLMCKRSDVPVQTSFRFYRNGVQAAVNVPRVLRKTTSADTEGGAIYDPDPDFVKDIGLAVDEVANARKARKAYELDEIVQQVKAANAKDRPHPDKIGVWFQVFKELLRREIGAGTFAVHTTTGWKYVSFELVHNFDKHKVEMYISDPALETRFKTVAKEVRKLYDEACEAIRAEAGGGRRKRQRKG